jgi:hypothetical protein
MERGKPKPEAKNLGVDKNIMEVGDVEPACSRLNLIDGIETFQMWPLLLGSLSKR